MTDVQTVNVIVTRELPDVCVSEFHGFEMIHFCSRIQLAGKNASTPSETRIEPAAELWFPFKPVSQDIYSSAYRAELVDFVSLILKSHRQPHEVVSAATRSNRSEFSSWNDWIFQVR